MSSTTTSKTIDVLRHVFAIHGLPDHLVSDNGPQFTSMEFQHFLRCNGIKHTQTALYHPATNSIAERFVQTFKKAILAGKGDARSSQHKFASFLLHYRSTPHSVTGVPPCVLLNNRQLKTVLDLLKPDIDCRVQEKQSSQKKAHDLHCRERLFEVGDLVVAKIHHGNNFSWKPGTIIVDTFSPVSFVVKIESGVQWRCHIDQVQKRVASSETVVVPETDDQAPLDIPPASSEGEIGQEEDSQFNSLSPGYGYSRSRVTRQHVSSNAPLPYKSKKTTRQILLSC